MNSRRLVLAMRIKRGSDMASGLRSRLRPRGFTLVEIMVAAMLLVFAMAAVVPFFVSALNQSASVRYKSSATNIARERMEQIRQLDYREITDAAFLQDRFGTSETLRNIAYDITYTVNVSPYDTGVLKEITVTVSWAAPPRVSPASMTTMIHQQFVGPRISRVELESSDTDPLGTPFPLLLPEQPQPNTLRCYIAEADWDLVYQDLDGPGMAKRDVFARVTLVDANGTSLSLGDPDLDYKIGKDYLTSSPAGGPTEEVYFSVPFNSPDIPDGYWEFRATAFNEYEEPGNVWRLRTRVENGSPAAPTSFVALPQPDDETVDLYWSGGVERDRAYYVIKRSKWDWTLEGGAGGWGPWVYVDTAVDPAWTNTLDEGDAVVPLDPWGSAATPNWYQYRIWAIDIANKSGGEATAECGIPDSSTTTTAPGSTTTSASTTTTIGTGSYTVSIENKLNQDYQVVIKDEAQVVVASVTAAKRTTIQITSLSAGNYLITATSPGKPTLVQSFSLPDQAGEIVMTIL